MIIDRMNELRNLTSQEKSVVEHINSHPKDLLDMNVNELAKASFTSASTIIRLCKKLDVKGFSDLKLIYAREFPEMVKQKDYIRKEPFDRESSIDDIISLLPMIYHRSINYTQSLLSRNTIVRVTNLMKQAQRIEIYGDGCNYDLGNMMAYRFESAHKDCHVYNASHWEHIKYLEFQNISTLAILISRTGKNPMVIDAAKRLKNSGIKTVSISANSSMDLANITDENIQIIDLENDLEMKTMMFTVATQYVLDVCITSLMVHNFDNVDKVLKALVDQKGKWLK